MVALTLVTGKLKDWFRNPASSSGLALHFEPFGGPMGGSENAIRFDLATTSALQKVAYSNLRLGGLRGAGLFSVAAMLSGDADRTKVAVCVRWNPARLTDVSSCYMAELGYAIARTLHDGAADTGANTKITSATAQFTAADRGRSIVLVGAGVSGADYVGAITAVDSTTQVTVSPTILTTVTGQDLTLADVTCALRYGPDESGDVIFIKRTNAFYGFVKGQWIEVGLNLTSDTVGNLKLEVLARPNTQRGVNVNWTTFQIDSPQWYHVGSALVKRHEIKKSGEAGWQILTRAGQGDVRIGEFRARVSAATAIDVLPDVVVL